MIALEKINPPTLFTSNDKLVISRINNLPITGRKKWAHDDFSAIYTSAKAILIQHQDRRCFYCQKKNPHIDNDDLHIDHIVPIDEDPRFIFEEKNLVLTCKKCNKRKNNKPVLTKQTKLKYSLSPSNYSIIHAHIDTYSKHIDITGDIIFSGIDKKGKRTVYDCNLDRYVLEYLTCLSSTDREFVNAALKLLLTNDPKALITFVKAFP
ncbi:uncharacterized protein (TIGR02646 family) [Pseudomonas sp. 478]|uniref:HNH endonuclease n=1 Tax=unclassified Pseudomonas TaxID=196821 RepID=UPI000DAD546C|nr:MULTISPECIES: HNH endonuclease [unclassified Pseudomonas]PZW99376.1 uncharacterized protein (TIGR02646 family) [Pseudomonas sp. 478]TCV49082.1 uncharacterized protein (TIGR02646 family) [Pseudomonas sp. 460]